MKPIQKELDKILSHKKEMGIKTGILKLDEFTYGFRKKNLIVVGGCSSVGKTSLMTDFVIAAAHEVPVGVVSIEMGNQQVIDRMIANIADLNYHRLQKESNVTEHDRELLEQAKTELLALNDIFFSETHNTMYPDWMLEKKHPENSIEIVMQDMYDSGARIFFFDYLQLIQWGFTSESETLRLKNITNKFHDMTLKFDVPIIILSQLTKATADRAHKKDQDPTPTLSDLRDSGYIINDADIVLLIHRPEQYKKKKESLDLLTDSTEDASIIIAKQRNGPVGVVNIEFRAYSMSFANRRRNKNELF